MVLGDVCRQREICEDESGECGSTEEVLSCGWRGACCGEGEEEAGGGDGGESVEGGEERVDKADFFVGDRAHEEYEDDYTES